MQGTKKKYFMNKVGKILLFWLFIDVCDITVNVAGYVFACAYFTHLI